MAGAKFSKSRKNKSVAERIAVAARIGGAGITRLRSLDDVDAALFELRADDVVAHRGQLRRERFGGGAFLHNGWTVEIENMRFGGGLRGRFSAIDQVDQRLRDIVDDRRATGRAGGDFEFSARIENNGWRHRG